MSARRGLAVSVRQSNGSARGSAVMIAHGIGSRIDGPLSN
ncbi:hypothetical protein NJ7G_3702 [Natrinema sp. J7-2]|nr:hypothetical protein NJ7G_3702 [Natrinema sp. J7-2]